MHFLDDRIEQHEDRQEDEEPNGLRFDPGKFAVGICFSAELRIPIDVAQDSEMISPTIPI
ncbi:hypothetical protein ACVWWI_006222 [Bradyrhizobium sp. USDA 3686]|uniref:hypothetical protein n=1 Tax=Bradyrhizobium canariense TaxID=255045 RepID=UPI0019573270|nr:hypothetical protein [Bradyrhizobium canariense]MBM7488227.1 hypothetical protein [Bradyrhizobium canariense]